MAPALGPARMLPPDYALAVAAGLVLLGRATDADRAKLDAAVQAARAADVTGTAATLAEAAAAWLAGAGSADALSEALIAFTTPFATRVPSRFSARAEPVHRGLIEEDAPLLSHAARVAAALETDR